MGTTDLQPLDLRVNRQVVVRLHTNQFVGIGTAAPGERLEVNGTVKATAFLGDGAGLTQLDPAKLSGGTAAIDISGRAATATTATTAASTTTATTATTAGTATSFTGPLAGDVTGTQAATVVGAIRGKPVSTASPSANQHLRYDGSQWVPGSVALATDVSGTLADARLSSNVALRDAHQTFSGSNTFNGVAIVTNTANQFAGTFSGSLSGNAATATTAAIATTATWADHARADAVDNLALQAGSVTADKIAVNQVVKSLNGLRDSVTLAAGANLTLTPSGQTLTLASPSDWHLGGNAGTSPATDFLGTTDGQPLAFRVDNVEAARLEPWRATFRVHDFELGHFSRHGTPGRALVDLGNTLALNFGPDWTNTVIGGHVALENNNDGALNPGLVFGALNSGEGIASKRTPGGNQWGLDFYTYSQKRMSIDKDGNVGIGTTTPQVKLEVAGTVKAERFIATASVPPGMVLIPAGPFTMGDSLDGLSDAIPISVTVSAFYMDVNEVTWSQWQSVYYWAGGHGYGFDAGLGKAANHPVQTVTWYDCVKWCNARSEQAGKTPVYYTDAGLTAVYKTGEVTVYANWAAKGYRLPTEAEWEKAARGGLSGERFPWGNVINQNLANYYGATGGYSYDLGPDGCNPIGSIGGTSPATSPVGSFAANGYGLNDMAGNVWEWCWDWYGTPYAGGSDPRGPASGTHRLLRGGSWSYFANGARCAVRGCSTPSNASNDFGFRCVRGL